MRSDLAGPNRLAFLAAVVMFVAGSILSAANLPNPAVDQSRPAPKSETAVLAGGCFRGIEAVLIRSRAFRTRSRVMREEPRRLPITRS
jgi:hypothetical protein